MLMPSPHQEHHDQYIQNYLKTGEAKGNLLLCIYTEEC